MDHSNFIKSVIAIEPFLAQVGMPFFLDEVITRWLKDNGWVEEVALPCRWCAHLTEVGHGFCEEECKKNVSGGFSCYRQTLATIVIPFLKGALRGEYPPPNELFRKIHRMGPHKDGMGDEELMGILQHELSPTYQRILRGE